MTVSSARPQRYVVLLRGVNLGARNRVPMARLREICEQAGCTDVKTYIASGNIVCTSLLGEETLRRRLETAIEKECSISIVVVVMTARQLAAVIKRNPFPRAAVGTIYVAFAAKPISTAATAELSTLEHLPEELKISGRQIYMHLPNGYGRVKLPIEVDRRAGQPTTVRNWRTVTTLGEMATIKQ